MTNKHDERVEDEKYTSHEAIKEWEAEKDQNDLTQNIVALLGIHGMHCRFYGYQNASHITNAFECLFHIHTKEVREQALAEGYKTAVRHLKEAYEANAYTIIPEAIEWLEDNSNY